MPTLNKYEVIKDPDSSIDFGFDYAEKGWLESGDTIAASTWTVSTGLTQVSSSFDDEQARVWLSGGDHGATYTATNQITTTAGRVDQHTLHVICLHK